MRVAIVVKSLKIGGMERAAINLADTFSLEGHESHLIYLKDKDRALSPNESVHVHLFEIEKILKKSGIGAILNLFAKLLNGIIRHSYFYFQGFLLTPIFEWKMKNLEKEFGKFDLVLIRGQGTFEMIWRYNEPEVVIQQVNILREYNTFFSDFFRRSIFSNKQIVCNAPSVKKDIEPGFSRSGVIVKSLHVIPSPINAKLIQERAQAYKIDFDGKYIINIGRFAPVKNISLLIESFAYAKKHLGLEHKLVLVGDGGLRESLESQAKELGVYESVYFTGALTNPYPWLKGADLFVFTSKNEGLPNVLLEALACEVDIVSTRGRGGTLDIMSGKLADNLTDFDAKEVAEKIMQVLDESGVLKHQDFLEPYTPKAVVQKYIDTFISK